MFPAAAKAVCDSSATYLGVVALASCAAIFRASSAVCAAWRASEITRSLFVLAIGNLLGFLLQTLRLLQSLTRAVVDPFGPYDLYGVARLV